MSSHSPLKLPSDIFTRQLTDRLTRLRHFYLVLFFWPCDRRGEPGGAILTWPDSLEN